jgi:hypothetical protein
MLPRSRPFAYLPFTLAALAACQNVNVNTGQGGRACSTTDLATTLTPEPAPPTPVDELPQAPATETAPETPATPDAPTGPTEPPATPATPAPEPEE